MGKTSNKNSGGIYGLIFAGLVILGVTFFCVWTVLQNIENSWAGF